MNTTKPKLLFVSPVFLFPNDSGGKIRTSNILRGLKGGKFHVTLVSPGSSEQVKTGDKDIASVCDEYLCWTPRQPKPKWLRFFDLFDSLPINVVADRTEHGIAAVGRACKEAVFDLVVFDFVHSTVLMPPDLACKSICFTHNVEAEIFQRHADTAQGLVMRMIWRSQYRKMVHFEHIALAQFSEVIAVSERDAKVFRGLDGITAVHAIPTGVDLDYFKWRDITADSLPVTPTVVFTGSMDWAANIEGIRYFLTDIWPLVIDKLPSAKFVVVGRNPPEVIVKLAKESCNVEITGYVDDVRPFVYRAHVFVIPLLVGGGTRIKGFEAMAMGCPIVSTSIGMEGLDAIPETHYLERNHANVFASSVISLLVDSELRNKISQAARQLVEKRFGHMVAAKAFESICMKALC